MVLWNTGYGLEVEASLDFHDKIFTPNAPISTKKCHFQLTQAKSLALALIESVTLFLGHPVYWVSCGKLSCSVLERAQGVQEFLSFRSKLHAYDLLSVHSA